MQKKIEYLQKNQIMFACVTNTQPEHLKAILPKMWKCPVLSHPFTPYQFYWFIHDLYGSNTYISDNLVSPIFANAAQSKSENLQFSGHVLLVEDNSINQTVAGEMLRSFGLTFDIAEDGSQAVTKVKNSPHYDLILMDIQMPVLDGKSATRQIREMGHDSLPIIGLSANAMKQDYASAKDAGMNDYITKPMKRHTLAEFLSRYLPEVAACET